MIPSGGRLNALAVMRDLFETLRAEFQVRIFNPGFPSDPLRQPIVNLARQVIDKIGLFESGVQSATLTLEESDAEVVEAGLGTSGTALLLVKFLAKYQTQRTEKNIFGVSLRPPTPIDLAEVCGVIVETLLNLKLIQHALILVDDADLLEAYITPEQNARDQRSLLADALQVLHSAPGIDVVVTARSWYAHSRKELQTLVDLARSPTLSANELKKIHDQRFRLYGSKDWPYSFLTESALQQLAKDTEGLPGVFLQHLNAAFYEFQNEDGWQQHDYAWLINVFRSHIDNFREKCGPAFAAIEKSLKEGAPNVDVSQNNPFFGTVIDNEFVYQSYYSETTYFMSGILRKILDVDIKITGVASA
jgi:hypothetical protein